MSSASFSRFSSTSTGRPTLKQNSPPEPSRKRRAETDVMLEGLHKIVSSDETIVAISTPMGRSGIGVVRMSGMEACAISRRFFRTPSANSVLEHRTAMVGMWLDADAEQVDEVVVTFFRAPHSYTGEDVIEISAHGNPLILKRIVETVKAAGARIAAPGEFTLREFANGKLDLVKAEAVRDFIDDT